MKIRKTLQIFLVMLFCNLCLTLYVLVQMNLVQKSSFSAVEHRIVELESTYYDSIASGLAANHPKLKSIRSELSELKASGKYDTSRLAILSGDKITLLKAQRASLVNNGIGENNPKILSIESQIKHFSLIARK